MSGPSYTDLAPIAAIATGAGAAALSILRTSGAGAVDLLSTVFSRPDKLRAAAGHTVVYGWITGADGTRLDETLVAVYRAPRSYTGEEGADIICHGGYAAPEAVLRRLLEAGFREALRGEFTFRAFANGKLDLSKAESVLEMVDARTDRARENAVSRLSGAFKTEIDAIKADLVTALSALELSLDYSELDGVEDAPDGIPERGLLLRARARLGELSSAWASQRLYHEGALVVIAGKPNAGKSSVFNLLLKEERAIVSPLPGTTRDYLEATLDIAGIPVRLADTAGLRDTGAVSAEHDPAGQPDDIEAEGIRRGRALIDEADLVLYVVDAASSGGVSPDSGLSSAPSGRTIVLLNKTDLSPAAGRPPWLSADIPALFFSAKTGTGLPALLDTIAGTLRGGPSLDGKSLAPGTARQKTLLDRAAASLDETLTAGPLDLAAVSLKGAVDALGAITGEVTTEDILTTMFSRFCVGK